MSGLVLYARSDSAADRGDVSLDQLKPQAICHRGFDWPEQEYKGRALPIARERGSERRPFAGESRAH